jgi:hypothetical protein
VITASPSEYGIYINLSSMLLDTAPINFIAGGAKEIGSNMARIIDTIIQDEVMA